MMSTAGSVKGVGPWKWHSRGSEGQTAGFTHELMDISKGVYKVLNEVLILLYFGTWKKRLHIIV